MFPDLNIVIVGIIRNDKGILPRSHEHMLPGDDVYFVCDSSHLSRAMSAFGHEEEEGRNVIIAGGVGSFEPRKFAPKECVACENKSILYSVKDKSIFK